MEESYSSRRSWKSSWKSLTGVDGAGNPHGRVLQESVLAAAFKVHSIIDNCSNITTAQCVCVDDDDVLIDTG